MTRYILLLRTCFPRKVEKVHKRGLRDSHPTAMSRNGIFAASQASQRWLCLAALCRALPSILFCLCFVPSRSRSLCAERLLGAISGKYSRIEEHTAARRMTKFDHSLLSSSADRAEGLRRLSVITTHAFQKNALGRLPSAFASYIQSWIIGRPVPCILYRNALPTPLGLVVFKLLMLLMPRKSF